MPVPPPVTRTTEPVKSKVAECSAVVNTAVR
jgi:hypothetical protein